MGGPKKLNRYRAINKVYQNLQIKRDCRRF